MTATHPVVASLLAELPGVTVERAAIRHRGEYVDDDQRIRIKHGLRGAAWLTTIVHEAIHALRGDRPCDNAIDEARQEEIVRRDTARLLIDIRELGEVAAAYPGDAHRMADELGVDVETLSYRVKYLHPSERHYLRRRLEHTEESA